LLPFYLGSELNVLFIETDQLLVARLLPDLDLTYNDGPCNQGPALDGSRLADLQSAKTRRNTSTESARSGQQHQSR